MTELFASTQKKYGNEEYLREQAHQMFDESYPGFEYNFYFYNNEAKMLVHLFQLINKLRPDFLLFWNISFDIPFGWDICVYNKSGIATKKHLFKGA